MRYVFFIVAIFVLAFASGCTKQPAGQANNAANTATGANAAKPVAAPGQTPFKGFTAADIAKLKWLEGTWRGMDEGKPFFERYRLDGTTMIVETLADESLSKVEDTTRFELKDGEFGTEAGSNRSAASEITDDHVQFVPVRGDNSFRFERQPDGTWRAVLDWIGPDNAAQQKIYKMEPYKK